MTTLMIWIGATRLRTLPLAFSCIGMGAVLAGFYGAFKSNIFFLSLLTATFLQTLSNLANDYGDHIHGVDGGGKLGPRRAVESGLISQVTMKKAVIIVGFFSFVSGSCLIAIALPLTKLTIEGVSFFLLLVAAITFAVTYTIGKRPYGYRGFGDLFVFLFFGPVAVLGSLYLFTFSIDWSDLLPAISCGIFSVAVLNINNIRDMDSDRKAGKYSIPVLLGKKKAILYHRILIIVAVVSATLYMVIHYVVSIQFIFLVVIIPLLYLNDKMIATKPLVELDRALKQMVFIMFLFVLFFGVGILTATIKIGMDREIFFF